MAPVQNQESPVAGTSGRFLSRAFSSIRRCGRMNTSDDSLKADDSSSTIFSSPWRDRDINDFAAPASEYVRYYEIDNNISFEENTKCTLGSLKTATKRAVSFSSTLQIFTEDNSNVSISVRYDDQPVSEQLVSVQLEKVSDDDDDFIKKPKPNIVPSSSSSSSSSISSTVETKDVPRRARTLKNRQMTEWKRRGVVENKIEAITTDINQTIAQEDAVTSNGDDGHVFAHVPAIEDAMFNKLKKARDVECIKMAQASKLLKTILNKKSKSWPEQLIVERILLEAETKYRIIVNEIKELGYTEIIGKAYKHLGTVTISNFRFKLKSPQPEDEHHQDFYILIAICGSEMRLSNFTTPGEEDNLVFSDSFTFANIKTGFHIDLQVHHIKVQIKSKKSLFSFLTKKSKVACFSSTIYYENVNTFEMEESEVLKSSFRQIGEVNIIKDHLYRYTPRLVAQMNEDVLLHDVAQITLEVDKVKFTSQLSGFLTVGKMVKNQICWERKWCVLKNTHMQFFNYPQFQDSEPLSSINLNYCLPPLTKNPSNCARKKSFALKVPRPTNTSKSTNRLLKLKPNFVVDKFYFVADNMEDFKSWTEELSDVFVSLEQWNQLVFGDDNY